MTDQPRRGSLWRRIFRPRWLLTALLITICVSVVVGRIAQVTGEGQLLAALEARGGQVMLANPNTYFRALGERNFSADMTRISCADLTFFSNGIPLTSDELNQLTKIANLTALNIQGQSVTDASLSAVRRARKLTGLVLINTQVTDAGLVHLQSLKKLDTLALEGSQFTDASVSQLVTLRGLKWLYLDKTSITDAGLAQLAALTGLRELHVNQTKVTSAGIQKLQSMIPGVKIVGP